MKHPIVSYTYRNISMNKKQTITTVICFIICICSLFVQGNIIFSYIHSKITLTQELNGTQAATLKNVSDEVIIELTADKRISEVGTIDVYGALEIPNSIFNDYIIVGALDEISKNQTKIKLLSGHWPESATEIVLENSIYYKMGYNQQTVKNIELNVSLLDSEVNVSKKYDIVGICNDYSKSQSGVESQRDIRKDFPNAIVMSKSFQNDLMGENPIKHALINVNKNVIQYSELGLLLSDYAGNNGSSYINSNSAQIENENKIGTGESSLNYIFIIFISSTLFVAIMGLYFNMNINKQKTNENIRDLKFCGASGNNILQYILLREVICFCIALPIAAVIYIGICNIIEEIIASYSSFFKMHFSAYIFLFIIGIVILFIVMISYVNVIKVIKKYPFEINEIKTSKANIFNKISFKTKNPILLWGIKSTIRNSKKSISIFMSFALCVMLFLSSIIITDRIVLDLSQNIYFDYQIQEYNGAFFSNLEIPFSLTYGISEDNYNKIAQQDELKSYYGLKIFLSKIVITDETLETRPNMFLDERAGMTKDEYAADLKKFGYRSDERLISSKITGVNDAILNELSKYVISGKINVEDLSDGANIIIILDRHEKSLFSVGDKISFSQTLTYNLTYDDLRMNDYKSERFDREVTVQAIVDLSRVNSGNLSFVKHYINGYAWSNKSFQSLPFQTSYYTVFAQLKNEENYNKTEETLSELKTVYPDMLITSKKAEADNLRLMVAATKVIFRLIIALVAVFACFNIMNSLYIKIYGQKKSWGALRAIGLTKKQAVFCQYIELSISAFFACAFGIILAFPINLFMNRASFITSFPWVVIPFVLLALNIISFVLCIIPFRRLYKKSIVNLIQNID